MKNDPKKTRISRWLRAVLILIGAIAVVLVLEGGLSLMHMVSITSREATPVPADHQYTDFHSRYGWVATPGVSERDGYGLWRTLHTDDKGLRDASVSSAKSLEDASRVVCLGGTSTFGVGVGDDETWCQRLGLSDADYGIVNLGQPAYGAGQSLLHYQEFGELDHDIILLAVDDQSINQIVAERHKRFAKPAFDNSSGMLERSNTPVPRFSYLWPWATVNRESLAASKLIDWLMPSFDLKADSDSGGAGFILFDHIVAELRRQLDGREGSLILVYLPVRESFSEGGAWAPFLENETVQKEIPYVNLAEEMGSLPAPLRRAVFDHEGYITPFGHQYIAEELADRMTEIDELENFDKDGEAPWLARYYSDLQFVEPVSQEWHTQLALYWAGNAPHPELAVGKFGAIFDSCLSLETAKSVRVLLEADGRAQLAINDQTILHAGGGEEMRQRVNKVSLPAGSNHIRVRYMEDGGPASIRLLADWNGDRATVAGPDRFVAPAIAKGKISCRE